MEYFREGNDVVTPTASKPYRVPQTPHTVETDEKGMVHIFYYPVVNTGYAKLYGGLVPVCKSFDHEEAARFFEQLGFTLTEEAMRHNFSAWCEDYKSAYVDRENDIYLFTPCRHNDFRLEVCRLKGSRFENEESYVC